MPKESQVVFEESPLHGRLLGNKLGVLLTWAKPVLIQTIGPFDPSRFDAFDARRMALVTACVQKLRGFTEDQIAMLTQPGGSTTTLTQEWRRFQTNEIDACIRIIPDWYVGGFGHPDHVADFDYWSKMPQLNLGELTCLSVGIRPEDFASKDFDDLAKFKDRPKFSQPLEFLVKRYEQLSRRFGSHARAAIISPQDFLEWATRFDFEVHPGFLDLLQTYHRSQSASEVKTPSRKPDKREIDSIAQLFTAMAIDQFAYDPLQPRSNTTREIRDLASSLGLQITDDTILKYLRLGAKFISSDWVPPGR